MAGNVVVLRLGCMNRGVLRELLGIFTLDSIKTTSFDDHIGSYPGLQSCGIYIITPHWRASSAFHSIRLLAQFLSYNPPPQKL